MSDPITSPADLFEARLREMLFVEERLADEVLPRLLREAHSTDLRFGFERHLAETQGHVEIVRDLLSELGVRATPERSPALEALVAEHDRLLERVGEGGAVASDLVHAMAASATEHLEMASYDVLSSMAEAFGHETVAVRLRELFEQEELALELVDRAVTKLLAEEVESATSRPV
jgi:ferritin-like metal-binding protein YciE